MHRAQICNAYALTKTIVIVEPKKAFKDREEFLKTMATDSKFAVAYTRCLGQTADRFKGLKNGFRLELGRDELDKFVVRLKAPVFKVIKQPISLDMPYNPFHAFRDILAGKSDKDTRFSKHSVMFRSFSKNVFLLPRKGYVSFYDFSKKGSPAEIVDIWRQAWVISQELTKTKRSFVLSTRAGTSAGQLVPHFQLRFDLIK